MSWVSISPGVEGFCPAGSFTKWTGRSGLVAQTGGFEFIGSKDFLPVLFHDGVARPPAAEEKFVVVHELLAFRREHRQANTTCPPSPPNRRSSPWAPCPG